MRHLDRVYAAGANNNCTIDSAHANITHRREPDFVAKPGALSRAESDADLDSAATHQHRRLHCHWRLT